MTESEHKLLCTHEISRQPCKSKIAQHSSFRHHLTQPFDTELHVESSTGHVNADASILLIQLSFHVLQLVQRFSVTLPEILAARGALRLRTCLGTVSDDRSKVLRIFQPLESLSFDVHDVSLQVPSVFDCSWSDSVKHFDNDQLHQNLIRVIQLLKLSFSDDVVAMDCSRRVRLKAAAYKVTYLECCIACFSKNASHVLLEEMRCSSRSVHRSFHLPHASRIHRNRLIVW